MSTTVPVYTAEQVRAAERPLLDEGVPLMQRAAGALSQIIRAELGTMESGGAAPAWRALEPTVPGAPQEQRPRILVLAGGGDNGGDALFAAAGLTDAADVDVVLVGDRFHEAAFTAAIASGARRIELDEAEHGGDAYAVLVDGIVGIGASRDARLRGPARDAVTTILESREEDERMPRIVAVDIPSGLHPDTGAADDAVLPASVTVTFGAVKAGLITGRGPKLAGEVVLVDIGLADALASVEPAGEASVSRIVTAQR